MSYWRPTRLLTAGAAAPVSTTSTGAIILVETELIDICGLGWHYPWDDIYIKIRFFVRKFKTKVKFFT